MESTADPLRMRYWQTAAPPQIGLPQGEMAMGASSRVVTVTERIGMRHPNEQRAVKSAGRVIAILEFFADVQRGATLTEIAVSLGYPQSSASYLLHTLVAMGYLEHDPATRTYIPSDRVAVLGSWLTSPFVAEGVTISIMKELRRITGHSILLATRNDVHVQYIQVIQSEEPGWTPIALGAARPLPVCGAGYAILSTLPDAEIGKIVRRVNAEAPPEGPYVDIRALRDTLERVRADGFAHTHNLFNHGGNVIAVPLAPQGPGKPLVICVSAGLPLGDDVRDLVLRARDTIQARLAGQDGRMRSASLA
jgi:DNA-binding IclR family transcriptional regulator